MGPLIACQERAGHHRGRPLLIMTFFSVSFSPRALITNNIFRGLVIFFYPIEGLKPQLRPKQRAKPSVLAKRVE
ncbi:hypothetical protein EVAR_81011_1 [Eumeta japonica]|uniref:Uncharacterized protein n=1 Tax=Eumeta variegata TaxID=151549 RepID=A0A4C1T5N6_EUMVA|nr:hypothetical protein EVAR_81011_1 [Eumeta japonica]